MAEKTDIKPCRLLFRQESYVPFARGTLKKNNHDIPANYKGLLKLYQSLSKELQDYEGPAYSTSISSLNLQFGLKTEAIFPLTFHSYKNIN